MSRLINVATEGNDVLSRHGFESPTINERSRVSATTVPTFDFNRTAARREQLRFNSDVQGHGLISDQTFCSPILGASRSFGAQFSDMLNTNTRLEYDFAR